jgi:DNA-binding LacI/PurR family transcriptional regulator
MKRPRIVTMRHVAEAAGVARSTVSKALRNDPRISEERCRAVQNHALKLGYRPHPMVSALMAQIHQHRRRSDPHHIAWIDLWPKNEESATFPFGCELLDGARQRAEELGYSIDVHAVAQEKISPLRLRQILTARAQWGMIIPPVPESAMHFPLDLRGLTAVTIGTSLREPALHRVSSNHFQGAQLACEQLRTKGLERIGLVISPEVNERVEGKWCGAFLSSQLAWPKSQRLAPLLVDAGGQRKFREWLRREKPDALLIAEPHILSWLRGVRAPKIAWLVLKSSQQKIWGIDHRAGQLGGAAVELLVGQIHRNQRGVPPVPHTLLLDGVWAGS